MRHYLLQYFTFTLFSIVASCQLSFSVAGPLFTNEEKAWLRDHPNISIVVNNGPEPLSVWADPSKPMLTPEMPPPPGLRRTGDHPPPRHGFSLASKQPLLNVSERQRSFFEGVAADYLSEIGKITGINFVVTKHTGSNFGAIFDALNEGEVGLMPTIMLGHHQDSSLYLTDPYIRIPVVVVMRPDASYLEDINLLETMNVAGVLSAQMKIDSLGLAIKIKHVNPKNGLIGVATGKYDAFISELSIISHTLSTNPITNIKINGELPVPSEFSMAVSPQLSEFIPIFNKALKAIPKDKKDEIWIKWFRINFEKKYISTWGLIAVGIASIISLLIGTVGLFYYRRRLNKVRSGIAALEPHLLCVQTDANITITEVTEALCKATGFDADFLVGKPLKILGKPVSEKQSTLDLIFEKVRKEQSWKGEIKLRKKDGSNIWADVVISPQRRRDEPGGGFTVIYQDATKRKHFETLAVRDELTGLYNRRFYNTTAPEALLQARLQKKVFGFFLLDVDNFKKYNDNYGHPAGDRVLTCIGRTLRETLHRGADLSFRLGGEEFGVVASFTERSDAADIALRILNAIRGLQIEHRFNPPGIITVSIGVCVVSKLFQGSMEDIYKKADLALYEAKETGRNKYVISRIGSE